MNEPRWMSGPPKSILLATDLSSRCDRALDRAVALSEQWQAKLVIMHVLEEVATWGPDAVLPSWKRPPDPVGLAHKRLVEDIGEAADAATLVIEEGDPSEAIQRTAEARGCDLVVTGVARDEPFGRFVLGTTVDRLLRNSDLPVLIVKNRARRPYRNVLIATDFSEASRHALEAAHRYFPEQPLTIFHAYDPPMSGLVPDQASYRREYRKVAEQDYETFLKGTPSGEAIRKHARPLIEFGVPDQLLRDCVRDLNIDLVVLGTKGLNAIFEAFLGSVSKQIMAEIPCDALVMREPG
ncbi:universal stress protein [Pseudorhodoplanes sp.]|uniref:universal stress protein n=1 Tax=Pseudorhodoplanes sp. TaxID=1934341 RepID=UPI002C9F977E|nr:universal stress protein [Pseudorhodoplanes sp.]HWV55104.1 universal stress protein [Pseudorhodoplanes sp.]